MSALSAMGQFRAAFWSASGGDGLTWAEFLRMRRAKRTGGESGSAYGDAEALRLEIAALRGGQPVMRSDDAGSAHALQAEIARLRRRAQSPVVPSAPEQPTTRAGLRAEIDAEREVSGTKRIDPRVIAAEAQFRLRGGW